MGLFGAKGQPLTASRSGENGDRNSFIRLVDLSKAYQEGDRRRVVLHEASASFRQGEFVALLGRSGSGKSTLLNVISGIDRPDAGQVWIGGQQLTAMSERDRTLFRRKHIGFVFQFFNLIPTLTVLENVTLPVELNGASQKAARQAGRAPARRGGPARPGRDLPRQALRRRAAAHRDRPCTGPRSACSCSPTSRRATWTRTTGESVLTLLDRLTRQAGKNLIMVTHSAESAMWADRVFHLHDGEARVRPRFRARLCHHSTKTVQHAQPEAGAPAMSATLFNVGWRYLLRHPWQTVLMVIGIMLGVSVMVAIDLANSAASRAFDLSTASIAGKATHQIVGGPAGLDESVYTRLRLAGLPVPSAPVVADYITSPQLGNRPIQLLGVDPFAEAPFRSYLVSASKPAPWQIRST